MAIVSIEGFDDGMTAIRGWEPGFTQAGNGTSAASTPGRLTSNCWLLQHRGVNNWGSWLTRAFVADANARVTCGFAWRRSTTDNNVRMVEFRDVNGVSHVYLVSTPSQIVVYRGDGTELGRAAVDLGIDLWRYVEASVLVADSGGEVVLRVDGRQVLTFTGDTRNAGIASVAAVRWYCWDLGGNASVIVRLDDVYVTNGAGSANTGFLGDLVVETLRPNGNGARSDFVGSDGNSTDNFLLVDDPTPDTADFVGSATVGARDTYTLTDSTRTAGNVLGVLVTGYAQKSDAGPREVGTVLTAGGATAVAPGAPLLAGSWSVLQSVHERDPAGAVWTLAAVNGAEIGIEVTA